MTTSERYMQELTETIGRFATPTIVIGKEVLLGFAANRARIEELLGRNPRKGGETDDQRPGMRHGSG